jgi:DnaJ-class molecular chaperone
MGLFGGIGMILLGAAYKRTLGAKSYAKARYKDRARRDQGGFFTLFKNARSPINDYGTCFKCEGSGNVTLTCKVCSGSGTYNGSCRKCDGTGTFLIPERGCLTCEGGGSVRGRPCLKCSGTGVFRAAREVPCAKCEGRGRFSVPCGKCGGAGTFKVSCRKCSGSGWHKF